MQCTISPLYISLCITPHLYEEALFSLLFSKCYCNTVGVDGGGILQKGQNCGFLYWLEVMTKRHKSPSVVFKVPRERKTMLKKN